MQSTPVNIRQRLSLPPPKQQLSAVPDHIDEAAKSEPDAIWALIPHSNTDPKLGYYECKYAELARAVDDLAWWIQKEVGIPDPIGQAIGYMGANGLNYLLVLAATLKVGYVPLFVSPRNSIDGQISILQDTDCRVFLTGAETLSQVKSVEAALPHLSVFTVPSPGQGRLLGSVGSVLPYVGRHSRDGAAPCIILHTSGSTGLPKPVRLTVHGLNSICNQASLENEDGLEHVNRLFLANRRPMLAAVPFFHAMGIVVGLRSLMCRGTIAALPPGKLMAASLVIDAIEAIKPSTGVFPPSILEDVSATTAGIAALGTLQSVFFGGAPLANASGDKISKVTKLQMMIGSTEALLVCSLASTSPEEWCYFRWSSLSGACMEPTADGMYELVLKRADISHQTIFHTFPELQEWRTKDLFTQHPSKPFLWKYGGRTDDIIVLSNGEKVNPVSMEKLIESYDGVKGALVVVGQDRFQTGLLIEPERGQTDADSLVEQMWPLVEQANREAPAHARIYRTKIAVAKEGKSFLRAAKGSIIRSQTVAAFRDEIEALYLDPVPASCTSERLGDDTTLKAKIRAVFSRTLHSFTEDVSDDTDFSKLNIDSLDVWALSTALNVSIRGLNIMPATVYNHPTINQLSIALSKSPQVMDERPGTFASREERLAAMVRKYTKDAVRPKKFGRAGGRPQKETVLLTGSTGSLGGHILKQLLQHPGVEKVYCLNRSGDAENIFQKRHGVEADLSKAVFLKADLGCDIFGLPELAYTELLATVTAFIHAAWCVDFNLSLESYEAVHLAGTRHAMEFSANSLYTPKVTFVSSVASVGRWSALVPDGAAVPESTTTLFDSSITLEQGYAESKHVAAQILAILSHRFDVKTAIVRAGQLAGPSEQASGAAWNRHEWLPTLIQTSKILGKLPKTIGSHSRIDWVPMDIAAGTIIDLMTVPAGELTQVYHLANPHAANWSQLWPVVQDFYRDANMEMVAYKDWVQELRQIPHTRENAERVPGLKLLDFYDNLQAGLPVLQTKNTEAASETLRRVRVVDERAMRQWLQQWGFEAGH